MIMNRIIVDDALKFKIQHLTAPALLTDAQGNTIGPCCQSISGRSTWNAPTHPRKSHAALQTLGASTPARRSTGCSPRIILDELVVEAVSPSGSFVPPLDF
jgi:hypothetical protein